ncbi:MAG TPA: alpha/beta hydrolase [Anaerolineales bacterium]|nr:alpha/beta hydrolase [Anaerolineales bacterium]
MLPDNVTIPTIANDVRQGEGTPIVLIHGLAASLHDWDDLIPELTTHGHASYALDLLGHGDSPKLDSHAYQMEWVYEHFSTWMRSLHLTEPVVIIGHSLGGYIALEYARRTSVWTRGLVLVNPFYSRSQLNILLRRPYTGRNLKGLLAGKTPTWLYRALVEIASMAMRLDNSTLHSLPERVRAQTALDFARTSPGIFNVTNTIEDLTERVSSITIPTLVVWGERDQTLSPSSFPKLVDAMPRATGKSFRAGHVPHQSHAEGFNRAVVEFLRGI